LSGAVRHSFGVRTKGSLTVFAAIIICFALSACSGPLSTLDPAGPAALAASRLWWGIFIGATVVLAAVVALWLFAIQRDPRSGTPAQPTGAEQTTGEQPATGEDTRLIQRQHQAWIIGGGIVLPVAAIAVLLMFSIPTGSLMSNMALEEYQAQSAEPVLRIDVIGHQWWWQVTYLNTGSNTASNPGPASGAQADIRLRDEIHIPVGVPVRLFLSSADVIHSFWVPRLGGKLDMIPGRTNELRLQADEPGVYPGVCAEFCGLLHAQMKFTVHAHTPEDFAAWVRSQQTAPDANGADGADGNVAQDQDSAQEAEND